MKVATYVRVSAIDPVPEPHREALASLCRQRGWSGVEFLDPNVTAGRPGFEAMMAAVRAHEVNAVVCVRLDAIATSGDYLAGLAEGLGEAGAGLVTARQGVDTVAKPDQMAVLAAFAESWRYVQRERTMAGMKASPKKSGRPTKKLPGPEEVRRIVAEWRAQGGENYRELGRRLGGVGPTAAMRVVRRMEREG